jgi:hypothetical protein
MGHVNVVSNREGTILSDGINKYFFLRLCVFLRRQFWNLLAILHVFIASVFVLLVSGLSCQEAHFRFSSLPLCCCVIVELAHP